LFGSVMVPYVNKYDVKYFSVCCLLRTIRNIDARVVEREEMIFGYAGPEWRDLQRRRCLSGTEDVELVVPALC
jgi:hypothetical protein